MPLQQDLQRVITADDFTNKSFRFTMMPGADQNSSTQLANTSPENKPVLMVSHSMLTFARTSPGRPAFIILTISQQHADTPITLSTDSPEHFQFATDNRPSFSPGLTFTPSPTGTYVHVRFAANQVGSLNGKLFIETPYESQTLAMKGSSWSLLPALHTPNSLARTTQAVPVNRIFSGGWRAWVVSAAMASGLVLGGYFYWSQSFQKIGPNRSLIEVNQSQTVPLIRGDSLKTTEYATTELSETQTDRKQTKKKRSEKRLLLDSLTEKRPVEAPVSIDKKLPSIPKNSLQSDSQQANARPRQQTVVVSSANESELEKVLNKKVQQP